MQETTAVYWATHLSKNSDGNQWFRRAVLQRRCSKLFQLLGRGHQ